MSNARNLANLLGTKTKVKDVDVDGTELILDADADTSITADTDDQIDFKTGGSDRVIIDSSGNLLVGKTSVSGSTVGGEIRSDGRVLAVVDDNFAAFFARKSADGEIVRFLKDTTTVGSISAVSSDLAIFSSASSHTGLRLANGYIAPTNNSGTISDNTADLGISNYRFKDLFLSGGAYIGGTGSANYLDDYEEGTFTPTTSTSGYTVSDSSATYTKVGRLVNLNVRMVFSAVNSSSNSNVNCNNVPFVKVAGDHAIGVGRETSTNGAMFVCQISQNTNVLHMNSMDGIGNNSQEAFQANKHYKFHIAFET